MNAATARRAHWGLAAATVGAAAAAWWFGDKAAPYPYAQRGLLDLPLPYSPPTGYVR